jgi:RNA polymerase sigma-70 factor, ECF subfamily
MSQGYSAGSGGGSAFGSRLWVEVVGKEGDGEYAIRLYAAVTHEFGTSGSPLVSNRLMSYSIDMAKSARSDASFTIDPDLELLRRMARQDEDALADVYHLYGPGLLAYLKARLGDRRLAEEVLQEVMVAAWRAAPRFRGECRVRTWLLAIARTRAINAYQREIRRTALDVPISHTQDEMTGEAPVSYGDLEAGLKSLPAEQREALELVFYHGLSLQETAQVLQVPLGTVKSRLHRAKAQLRHWLER